MSFVGQNFAPRQWDDYDNLSWHDNNTDDTNSNFIYRNGKRCRIVCDDRDDRHDRDDLRKIARRIIELSLPEARRIYPNIRVVMENGRMLPVTQDHQYDRINVATQNGYIVRVVGFY
jgi:hypothetical protein